MLVLRLKPELTEDLQKRVVNLAMGLLKSNSDYTEDLEHTIEDALNIISNRGRKIELYKIYQKMVIKFSKKQAIESFDSFSHKIYSKNTSTKSVDSIMKRVALTVDLGIYKGLEENNFIRALTEDGDELIIVGITDGCILRVKNDLNKGVKRTSINPKHIKKLQISKKK